MEDLAQGSAGDPSDADGRRAGALADQTGGLAFETLHADLSAQFVNLPSQRIDGQITDALRRICAMLDLDLAAVWQRRDDVDGTFVCTHILAEFSVPEPPERMYEESFPWYRRQMLEGRTIVLRSIRELPAEAAVDRVSADRLGIKSNITIPLSVGEGPTIGLLGLNTLQVERDWPATVIERLRLLATIFSAAIARKRADVALRESEQRLLLASEAGEVGLWALDLSDDSVWGSDIWRRLFAFPPGVTLTSESVYERIHVEDRPALQASIQRVVDEGGHFAGEFRVLPPEGGERWIASRGSVLRAPDGTAHRIHGAAIDLTARKRMEQQLQERLREIEELKRRLELENVYLQEEIGLLVDHTGIVGKSRAISMVLRKAEQVAATNSTVLLAGETGTGKELLARAIHRMSSRRDRPLVTVNCASLPATLIESELFGREKGAYTDALTRMAGRFELATGSTLFLDEVGELPLNVQAKLLRVLEDGSFQRLGSTDTLHTDARIIAATNRDLRTEVRAGHFREDLYYRLHVFPIDIPPLRDRIEDLPLLVWAFIRDLEKQIGKRIDRIEKRSMEAMLRYAWPGNVRELRNVIEYGMIVSSGGALSVRLPQADVHTYHRKNQSLDSVQRSHILNVLQENGWRIGGADGAAEILGLKRTTLQSLMLRLGIARPSGEPPK